MAKFTVPFTGRRKILSFGVETKGPVTMELERMGALPIDSSSLRALIRKEDFEEFKRAVESTLLDNQLTVYSREYFAGDWVREKHPEILDKVDIDAYTLSVDTFTELGNAPGGIILNPDRVPLYKVIGPRSGKPFVGLYLSTSYATSPSINPLINRNERFYLAQHS